ncbi:histidine phosphatase family protein [Nannocystis bainbridge]|uniref:Histidine phosphatase family protein n=1 Tax=Nannocystis bainbridge TaxID=2995303 RepID=A0ABT5DVV3_9BACT|nr:histidine phosphatase family protein [Nannocystis bainbridge]MDC0717711.1 histidine phosphatase family protein [Nannocystis bainbridge]
MTGLRLYLVRHGEPIRPDVFIGHADVGLSARGLLQAEAAARALADVPLAAIYSSDLERATIGAARITALGPERPAPVILPALREMNLGVLEGVAFRDGRAQVPELASIGYDDLFDHRLPGAESVRDLAERVLPCILALVARHLRGPDASRRSPAPAIAVVAHNTVNRVVLACAAGLGPAGYPRFEQAQGALSRVDFPATWSAADPWATTRIGLVNWSPGASETGETNRRAR